MPPRVPVESDFADLQATVPHKLHFPSPPESTTALMLVFHGLGDTHTNFSAFAPSTNLPGVMAVTVRGTSRLPDSLGLGIEGFHWGDDLIIDQATGDLDDDAGFDKAEKVIMDEVLGRVIIGECGWETTDVLLFGFGQGGTLALGLAAKLADQNGKFKGAVSVGGSMPASMAPKSGKKSATEVLVVQLEDDEPVKRHFDNVRVANWDRKGVDMPRNRDEMVPIMKFFAERLNSGWPGDQAQAQAQAQTPAQ
ncbi:putative esterase [Geosmithia morbida]|uniref:Esterase n=1 Tax=Geosmithia morbida TaxID=1094350 RepID=A0A9P5CYB7_9HYPO|nr:putative esterase [Geosmithia morbida]KAF4120228.1 putative esterase [Geosmithia morbida]